LELVEKVFWAVMARVNEAIPWISSQGLLRHSAPVNDILRFCNKRHAVWRPALPALGLVAYLSGGFLFSIQKQMEVGGIEPPSEVYA